MIHVIERLLRQLTSSKALTLSKWWNYLKIIIDILFIFIFIFITSISICNRNDYNTVLCFQKTHSTNAPILRVDFAACFVPVAFSRYVPRLVPLSGLQAPYINDSNRPPNGIKQPWAPFKSPQFRPDIVAIRIGPQMENHETMSPYRMPPIWALFRPRVFGPKASFVLPIRIRLSDGKFC